MAKLSIPIPWLLSRDAFPPVDEAWGKNDPAPGLLAAGGTLDVSSLVDAYSKGIFPWFSTGQPVLWWSTDPRMVLKPQEFKLHRSLAKTLARFQGNPNCEIRFDSHFEAVIGHCSTTPRDGQHGTWIVPSMVEAYLALHAAGYAHSVETWIDGQLVGGLYCVNLGRMVYGESMFAHRTDASKIALAALVAFCRANQIDMVDCQQNTQHLASLGAVEIRRCDFLRHISQATRSCAPNWVFEPVYWRELSPKPC